MLTLFLCNWETVIARSDADLCSMLTEKEKERRVICSYNNRDRHRFSSRSSRQDTIGNQFPRLLSLAEQKEQGIIVSLSIAIDNETMQELTKSITKHWIIG